MLTQASLTDCPFENACKVTGSQPYTPSYDASGRTSGSVGELRSRVGGSARGPSSGDTLQSRVRDIYLSALKARAQGAGDGPGAPTALEAVAVSAGEVEGQGMCV
jgi:hypothetical protein